jgi:hypothetical protein
MSLALHVPDRRIARDLIFVHVNRLAYLELTVEDMKCRWSLRSAAVTALRMQEEP